jgi:hypothetical protein
MQVSFFKLPYVKNVIFMLFYVFLYCLLSEGGFYNAEEESKNGEEFLQRNTYRICGNKRCL